jgi:hypothetical protein
MALLLTILGSRNQTACSEFINCTQLFIFDRNFENFSVFCSTETSLETSYGFDIPKIQSQKIPESTLEVSVDEKKFFAK